MPKKTRILCVDDAPDHLQLGVELLKRFGYETLEAHDHRSALRAASRHDIDLCITDYHLKNGETGEEIARDIRVVRPRAALILLTGDAEVARSVRKSFDAVLIKGGGPATLRDAIRKVVGGGVQEVPLSA